MTARGAALVTGASRGIGRAIALRLAAAGWPVAVNYRADESGAKETVTEIENAGGSAALAYGDVSQGAGIDEAFGAASELGPVLALINNAGIRRDGLAALMKEDDWQSVLRTNLEGAFFVTKRALKPMLKARWGRVVNVSSVVGLKGNPGQTNYAAAKAGLIGLTKSLAVEVAGRGITVNAIAPGIVRTTLTESLEHFEDFVKATPIGRVVNVSSVVGLKGNPGQTNYAAAKAGLIGLTKSLAVEVAGRGITVNAIAPGIVRTTLTESLEHFEDFVKATPIGRVVEADEVAAAVAFLVSDDAAAITGQVLCVDGGMTA